MFITQRLGLKLHVVYLALFQELCMQMKGTVYGVRTAHEKKWLQTMVSTELIYACQIFHPKSCNLDKVRILFIYAVIFLEDVSKFFIYDVVYWCRITDSEEYFSFIIKIEQGSDFG